MSFLQGASMKKFFGSPLGIPPTIAADSSGRPMLFQIVGGLQPRCGETLSGVVVALKLKQSATSTPQQPPTSISPKQTQQPAEVQPRPIPSDLLIPIIIAVAVIVLFAVTAIRRKAEGKKGP